MRSEHRERIGIARSRNRIEVLLACFPALPQSNLHIVSAYRHERRAPDFLGVFAYRPIGGEPANIGCVQNARTHPSVPVTPSFIDPHLGLPVSVEVSANHEIIVMGERIDEAAITPCVVGREYAGSDFVERFVQSWGGGDIFGRIDA